VSIGVIGKHDLPWADRIWWLHFQFHFLFHQ